MLIIRKRLLFPFAPMYMAHVAGRNLKTKPSKTARAWPKLVEKLSAD